MGHVTVTLRILLGEERSNVLVQVVCMIDSDAFTQSALEPNRGGIRQRRGLPEAARKLIGTTDSESIAVRENDRRGLVLFVYLSILERHFET